MTNKAILIDRDGVINPDPGYIDSPEQISPYPYTARAIKIFKELGYKTIIITNQSGIARGYLTPEKLEEIHTHLLNQIEEGGGEIDKIYYAPYHKDGIIEPYNIEHEDRKPGIGMFKKAAKDFDLLPQNCWMIGDRFSDMKLAASAGIPSILVLSGDGKRDYLEKIRGNKEIKPDYIVQDLLAAALLLQIIYEG